MPAAARGRFFFSMSLQTSRIFVIIFFVALTSLIYVSSHRINGKVLCRLPAISYRRLLLTWSSLHAKAEGGCGNQSALSAATPLDLEPRKTPQICKLLAVASQVLDWSTVC